MKKKRSGELLAAIGFLLPFMIVYIMFMIYPILKGFYTSMCDVKLDFTQNFSGLDNYEAIFTDRFFWQALKNTLVYTVFNTPTLIIFGLGLALILNAKLHGNVVFRTIFFLPYVLSISVVAYIWKFILQPYNGVLNSLLHQFGIQNEIMWLQDGKLVWIGVIAMTVWSGVGFNMIMFLAGLQEIDDNLYEAAEIDGAGVWTKFWYVTLPGLKNITLMLTVLQTIASMKLFSHTFILTNGGPGTETRSIVHYIYVKAFTENKLGIAAAMSVILLVIMMIFAIIQFRIGTERKDKRKVI